MSARRELAPLPASDAGRQRRTVARRQAWLLGALAVLFYLGYLSWSLLRGARVFF
jgi:hypothetical protein